MSKITHELHVIILFNDIFFVIQHKKTGIIMGRGPRSVRFSRLKITCKQKTLNPEVHMQPRMDLCFLY